MSGTKIVSVDISLYACLAYCHIEATDLVSIVIILHIEIQKYLWNNIQITCLHI